MSGVGLLFTSHDLSNVMEILVEMTTLVGLPWGSISVLSWHMQETRHIVLHSFGLWVRWWCNLPTFHRLRFLWLLVVTVAAWCQWCWWFLFKKWTWLQVSLSQVGFLRCGVKLLCSNLAWAPTRWALIKAAADSFERCWEGLTALQLPLQARQNYRLSNHSPGEGRNLRTLILRLM